MTVRTLCLTLLAAATTMPATAEFEGSWFQVEVLIFEHTGRRPENPENWPTYPRLERRSSAITVADPDKAQDGESNTTGEPVGRQNESPNTESRTPEPFTPLSQPEWTLGAEKMALEDSENYRVLYHQSWMQPVPGRNDVVPIRIDAGDLYGSQHELQGYLELYVERYLHLNTDLQLIRYSQTDNPFRLIDDAQGSADVTSTSFMGLSLDREANALGSNVFDTEIITSNNNQYYVATQSIEMKQRRRMRSTELHYIDNPELGLMIYIVPLEIDGIDETNPQAPQVQ
jgi:hypothetical protein